jgi:hypothetical protein
LRHGVPQLRVELAQPVRTRLADVAQLHRPVRDVRLIADDGAQQGEAGGRNTCQQQHLRLDSEFGHQRAHRGLLG